MENVSVDEAILFQRLQQDDAAAFKALFDLYWKPLYRTAYKRLNDRQEAEDIVQEVLASIWQRRMSITADSNGSLQSYLFTALRYRIISFYAAVKMERFQGEVLERLLHLQDDDHFSRLISKELQELIRASLQNMPDNMQRAYQLTRNEHYSIREVAGMLNLSEQTVKNLITTSSRNLRNAIERYYANDSSQTVTIIVLAVIGQQI